MDVAIGLWPFFIRYGYAILILGIALENAGLPLPGEVFLFAAGLLASTGSFKLFVVIALGTAGAVGWATALVISLAVWVETGCPDSIAG